jgi:cyclophilin family peptidyl-prolyl cis-trans isomerase
LAAVKAPFLRISLLVAACAALLVACGDSGAPAAGAAPSAASTSTSTSSGGSATAPSASSPAGAPAVSATTPCTTAQFGSPLQPRDAPANVHAYNGAPAMQIDAAKLYQVTISTGRGDIVLCLQPKLAANTVNNFVVLARNHFYDKLTFHRVVPGFVIQGGDPQGTGQGGPGYEFADEPVQGDYTPGCVAMANSGRNTNGSQFFICTADDTRLPKSYNLFGQVSKGMDVALKIRAGDVMNSVTVQEQQ